MKAQHISVVIPVLNERERVGLAIRSVAGAGEVVVTDGGSRDGSPGIARDLGCQVVSGPPGRGQQLRRGAEPTSGQVLVFLHADCRLEGDWTDQILAALAAGSSWGCFRQQIDARGRRFRWLEQGNAWRARRRGLVYGDQCLWLQRSLYQQCGGFAEVPLMEDVMICDRLRRLAGPPAILAGPVCMSARSWQRRGVVRQTIRNWILFGLFRCGVSPDWLAHRYRPT